MASVDEEVDGEDEFAVCGEEAWGHEGELGVAHHEVLVEEAPKFGCDGQVVSSSSELDTEIDEGLNTGAQGIQDAYILEADLVEVIVGSEKEIGWVMGFSRGDYYLKAKYVPRLILVSPMRKVCLAIKLK